MRILYVAIDQTVPGTKGGSTHVVAVAEGLAALGHDVHALAMPGANGTFPPGPARWHALEPPLGLRQLRFLRASAVDAIAKTLHPDLIMERATTTSVARACVPPACCACRTCSK